MSKNLIIGSTSKIALYLSDQDFVKVNSRGFTWEEIDRKWDTAILAFGENRKFLDTYDPYEEINVRLTLETINFLKTKADVRERLISTHLLIFTRPFTPDQNTA